MNCWRRELQIGVDCGGGSWRFAAVLLEDVNRWKLSDRVCKRHTSRTIQKFDPPPFVCSGRAFIFILDLVLVLPGRHFCEKGFVATDRWTDIWLWTWWKIDRRFGDYKGCKMAANVVVAVRGDASDCLSHGGSWITVTIPLSSMYKWSLDFDCRNCHSFPRIFDR